MCVAVDIIFCIKNSYCHSWLATTATAIVIVIRSFFLSLSRSLMTYRGFLKNISSCGFHFIFLAKNFETESKERFLSKYVFLFSRQSSIFLIWQQSVDFLLLHYLQYLGTYEACFFWGEIKCSRSFRLCENWYRKRDQGIVKKGWGIIYVLINYLLWLLCVCLSVYVIVCCGKSGNCFSLFLSRRRQLNSRSR